MGRSLLLVISSVFVFSCESAVDLNFCPGNECAHKSIFSDDFNRTDQTLDNSDWVVLATGGSSLVVDSNQVKPDTNSGSFNPIGLYDAVLSDSFLKTSFDFSILGPNFGAGISDGAVAIFAHMQSTSNLENLYHCGIIETVAMSHELALFEVISNTVGPVMRGDTIPLASGDVYRLQFTIDGSSLLCEITQTSGGSFSTSVSASSSAFSSGYTGFGAGKSGAAEGEIRVDNFEILGPKQ